MKLALSNQDLRSVLILGAGASYGDHAFNSKLAFRPPLDATFLERLALSGTRLSEYAGECLELAKLHFGSISGVGLEQLFTRIESVEFLLGLDLPSQLPSKERFDKEREVEKRVLEATRPLRLAIQQSLERCVAAVIQERSTSQMGGWHAEISSVLQPIDTVITFNYDTLIDHAIRWQAPWLWDPIHGRMYGVPVSVDSGEWNKRKPAETTGPFQILKLHGSIHFKRPKGSISRLELADSFDSDDEPMIIAPTQVKRIEGNSSLTRIWQAARLRMEFAEVVIVAGYSAPITDFRAHALLASRTEESPSLKLLLVANPSQADRQRVINLFKGRLDKNSVVMERDRIDNLVAEFRS